MFRQRDVRRSAVGRQMGLYGTRLADLYGLRGGQNIVETIISSGPTLVLCGIFVTCTLVIVGFLFGRVVFKMNPLLLLGAITGAMTSGGALSVTNEQAKSTVAGISYTGAYAFANVILTIAGTLIMLL